jgi:hypothetical protein
MSWHSNLALLRMRGWRRGSDGLWRHTPEIGGSFLTRNALEIERGTPVQQVVEASRAIFDAKHLDKSPPV